MFAQQKDNRLFVSTIILVVIHMAGIAGMISSFRDLFLIFSPVNLLLCVILLLFNHKDFNRSFVLFFIITFFAGFLIEVAGVKTGTIFGNYHYGKTLGIKAFDVPLIIGINWLTLVYCAGVICNKIHQNIFIKSIIGACLLVLLDLCIEPVAIKCDFWQWDGGTIPFQNYIAWFGVSFLFLLVFYSFNFSKENKLAKSIYIIQLVFFILLNSLLK